MAGWHESMQITFSNIVMFGINHSNLINIKLERML